MYKGKIWACPSPDKYRDQVGLSVASLPTELSGGFSLLSLTQKKECKMQNVECKTQNIEINLLPRLTLIFYILHFAFYIQKMFLKSSNPPHIIKIE